jgi:hypothetical protein
MADDAERLREIARDITERCFELPRWSVGSIVVHPDGYPVQIVSGALWLEFPDGGQRLVNQWRWIRLDSFGKQVGSEKSGEGWPSDPSVTHPSVGH